MSTTVRAQPRATGRARGSDRGYEDADRRDEQFDLLTATLIGVAIGAGTALLFRRGPRGERPITPMVRAAGRGARWAAVRGAEGARWAGTQGARGAKRAGEELEELWERVPREEIRDRVREYVDSAREAVDETLESELQDLRKAIRRQRKRLGI